MRFNNWLEKLNVKLGLRRRAPRRRNNRSGASTTELMESRVVLSVNSVFTAATGSLDVDSDADDSIVVSQAAGQVTVNGQDIGVAAADVSTLNVVGGPLANQIDLSGVEGSMFSSLTDVSVNGGAGDDFVFGSGLSDDIDGADGNDTVIGSQGNDTVLGGLGNDLLLGAAGSDVLDGQEGDDQLLGQGASRDMLTGGLGNDTLDGGAGGDRVVESGDVDFDLDNDHLAGVGDDSLRRIESAQLSGGASANHFDTTGFNGFTIAYGGAGNDLFDGGDGADLFLGFSGNDTLNGGGGDDILLGSAGRDRIDGADGNDILRGQGGSGDVLTGGLGDDIIDGGAGGDRILEAADTDFSLTDTSLAGSGNDIVRAVEQARLIGGAGNNTIDASAFSGTTELYGQDGDDVLIGGSSVDLVSGQLGNDTIEGGLGDDILFGDEGDDSISGSDGNDDVRGGLGTDILRGDSGDDDLFGDEGDDLVRGGLGDDHLDGGFGSDVLDGDDGIDFEERGFSGDIDTRQFATLTDPMSSTTGLVVYELASGNSTEVELKAQVFNAPAGTYDINIGGVVVGQLTVDASGNGFAAYSSQPNDPREQLLSNALPTIHDGVTVEIGAATGSFGAVVIDNGGLPNGGLGAGESELNALLRGNGLTIGQAEYKVDIENGVTETSFEVEVYRASAGAVLPVNVNGNQVGTLTVNSFGFGKLKYTTNPDSVGESAFPAGFTAPVVGDAVSVGTGADAVTGTVGGLVVAGNDDGSSASSEIQLGTRLTGVTGAFGKAQYEVEFEHGRFESQFEVEIFRAPPNSALPITVDGIQVGTINTNSVGFGKLEYKDFPHEAGELPFPAGFVAPGAGNVVAVGGVAQGTLLNGFDD